MLSEAKDKNADTQRLSYMAEDINGAVCEVLILGQGSTDWFTLRPFRITGLNAGVLI